MEKSSKRGKIPQQDWPSIIDRYKGGETLASIARTYDCSPPAISYIVSRSRARDATAEGPTAPTEPRLIKGQTSEMPATTVSQAERAPGAAAAGSLAPEATGPVERMPPERQPIESRLSLVHTERFS